MYCIDALALIRIIYPREGENKRTKHGFMHYPVIALELADAREGPGAVALRVGRVAQLAGRAHADLDLHDGVAHEGGEVVAEGAHEVGVALDGRAALEHGQRVAAEGDVLVVPAAAPVGVGQVLVLVHLLHNPSRKWYAATSKAK